MNKVIPQLKMHYLNNKKSLIIFWTIMVCISFIGISLALYLRSRGIEGSVTTNNSAAIIIFAAIASAVSYSETFPYVISIGCTRKDFIYGFIAYCISLSLVMSLAFNVLVLGDYAIFKLLGFNIQTFGYVGGEITLMNFCSNVLLHFTFLAAISALFGLIVSITYLKGIMYLFGIGGLFIVSMFFSKARELAFEIMRFIGVTFVGLIRPYKMIGFSLLFFFIFSLLIYPITRITQVKR